MPISHPHRAIFIHIPKTAGTSIEAVLGMHGARRDVGIVPYFNQVPDREHLYGGSLQHLTAQALKERLRDDATFAAYFKFAFVRNPWDRLVSALAWTDQKWARGESLAVAEFDREVRLIHATLEQARATGQALSIPAFLATQVSFVHDVHGRPLVDFIGRYERLDSEWPSIAQRVGVDPVRLPLRMRSHHRDYRDYYCEETRRLVAEMYAADIQQFEYRF